MIGRLRSLLSSALPGRGSRPEAARLSAGNDADASPHPSGRRRASTRRGTEADRRIDAARRRLKSTIPPLEDGDSR